MDHLDEMDERRIREIVRRLVEESLGGDVMPSESDPSPTPSPPKARRIHLAPGAEPTEEIHHVAANRGAQVVDAARSVESRSHRIALGADHAGYPLKNLLKEYLAQRGYDVDDCGTFTSEPVDYPDIAATVARRVASGEAWRGIVIDGAGIGSAIAANKVPGIRAAHCYDLSSARNAREHNDANLLTLGARMIGDGLARDIVGAFLDTAFAGGRHRRRLDKLAALEREAAPADLTPAGLQFPPGGD